MSYTGVIFDFEGTVYGDGRVYSDAEQLIIQLHDRGVILGIASNASYASIVSRLSQSGLLSYFHTIAGIDMVNFAGKPGPEVYLYAVHGMGIDPSSCLAIEDSVSGAESAHHAGIDVVAVRGAKFHHAKLCIDTLEDFQLYELLSITI